MVKIRLKRLGSKYNAFYRIVIADARAPRDGKYIEEIGYYNPHSKQIKVNEQLKNKWIQKGAIPSQTVKNLFLKLKKMNIKNELVVLPKKNNKSTSLADNKKNKIKNTNNNNLQSKETDKNISIAKDLEKKQEEK